MVCVGRVLLGFLINESAPLPPSPLAICSLLQMSTHSKFIQACKDKNVAGIRACIEEGVDVNQVPRCQVSLCSVVA